MFYINSSIFLFLPIFLFFIVGQMMPSISGIPIPMMNNINTGNGKTPTPPTIQWPVGNSNSTLIVNTSLFNFTSRLDDQNRALMDKFLHFGKFHSFNEMLAETKEILHEFFDAIDEDKDGNLTRQELYLYGMEVMIPYVVEKDIKNMNSKQREQYFATGNANIEVVKALMEFIVEVIIKQCDQNGDGMMNKMEMDIEFDKLAQLMMMVNTIVWPIK